MFDYIQKQHHIETHKNEEKKINEFFFSNLPWWRDSQDVYHDFHPVQGGEEAQDASFL